jgi:hypothetical protein
VDDEAYPDSQGAVMPGVSVVIKNQATGIERTALTDAAGQYDQRPSQQ